eukprot:c15933_g1_i1.p1 GENE.c15933_g1_i1~~c15933_g1_i1.p1  ORF type:complete len:621 (+),score=141.53 c15933_g1_i1:46-1863(+)
MTDRTSWSVPRKVGPNGPLYKHQADLPRLPIPSLSETCVKYLHTVRPLSSDKDFETTVANVNSFLLGGSGDELQKRLQAFAKQKNQYSSWFIDHWNEIAYFGYRDPIVFNVSYFYQFSDLPIFNGLSNVQRAAWFVSAALKFREMIVNETLEPEPSRVGPAICASMYPYMFNACRIPAKPSDHTDVFDPHSNPHITVARKDKFYYFDVFDGSRQLSVAEIAQQLSAIIALADQSPEQPAIGALTSDHRDTWTDNRINVIAAGNQTALDIIERSILMVCLDTETPTTPDQLARLLWHGNGRNRWYDKSIEIIVTDNGRMGLLGEHSIMDGTPTLRMANWCLESIVKKKIDAGKNGSSKLPLPQEITWKSTPQIAAAIKVAEKLFTDTVIGHDLNLLLFDTFGREQIKEMQISPDAFAQMAIQLAFFRMYGYPVATYESCQTRSFLHGRTEVIRTCSSASLAFCRAMSDAAATDSQRLNKFKTACNSHVAYATDASMARGVDRHLAGLKMVRKAGESYPIFDDPNFSRTNNWRLSTSMLASEYFDAWGFGEVVPDGFGVGYTLNHSRLAFCVTSRCLGSQKFAELLRSSLLDLATLCKSQTRTAAKL